MHAMHEMCPPHIGNLGWRVPAGRQPGCHICASTQEHHFALSDRRLRTLERVGHHPAALKERL